MLIPLTYFPPQGVIIISGLLFTPEAIIIGRSQNDKGNIPSPKILVIRQVFISG
jgi:hypothetical protein